MLYDKVLNLCEIPMEVIIFKCLLSLFMVLVIFYDAWKFIIPNWVNLVLILLYPVACFFLPIDWLNGVITFLAVFAVLLVAYRFNLMGGGDIKYLTVCALWTGYPLLIQFFIATAISGGILAVLLLMGRPVMFGFFARAGKIDRLPRIFQAKEPVPYGIAISVAILSLIWMDMLFPAVKG